MSTFILGLLIAYACVMIVRRTIRRGSSCEECTVPCAVKYFKKDNQSSLNSVTK